MNKEEIEDIKDNLRTLHKVLWNEHKEGTYTIERILEYIKELEQKESILDKVTDKLKEDIKNDYCIKEYTSNEYGITGAKEYPVKPYAREILNIIEGENHE